MPQIGDPYLTVMDLQNGVGFAEPKEEAEEITVDTILTSNKTCPVCKAESLTGERYTHIPPCSVLSSMQGYKCPIYGD